MLRARHKLVLNLLGGEGYLLNQNFLDPAQYETGGWLRDNFSRSSTATRTNSSGLIESVAIDVPRLQHDASGNPLGYLHEPQATNRWAWSVPAAGDAGIAVQEPGATGSTLVRTTGTSPAGADDTISVWTPSDVLARFFAAIGGAGTFCQSVWVRAVSGTETFRLSSYNPTDGTQSSPLLTATSEWQRFDHAVTTTTPATNRYIRDSSGPLEIWGMQVEGGSVPTSLIPTSGLPATRQADGNATITDAGEVARLYNGGKFTFLVEAQRLDIEPQYSPFIGFFEDPSNRFQINFFTNSGWQFYIRTAAQGAVIDDVTGSTFALTMGRLGFSVDTQNGEARTSFGGSSGDTYSGTLDDIEPTDLHIFKEDGCSYIVRSIAITASAYSQEQLNNWTS